MPLPASSLLCSFLLFISYPQGFIIIFLELLIAALNICKLLLIFKVKKNRWNKIL
jgi:hypothetical protein